MAKIKGAALACTNLQATDNNNEHPDYQKGFQKGWWQQPKPENPSPEWERGYKDGWNTKVLDSW